MLQKGDARGLSYCNVQTFLIKSNITKQKIYQNDEIEDDYALISEKLTYIAQACADYDSDRDSEVMLELKLRQWSKAVMVTHSKIEELVFHSEFEQAAQAAREKVNLLNNNE